MHRLLVRRAVLASDPCAVRQRASSAATEGQLSVGASSARDAAFCKRDYPMIPGSRPVF
jgi:hypothetical protein